MSVRRGCGCRSVLDVSQKCRDHHGGCSSGGGEGAADCALPYRLDTDPRFLCACFEHKGSGARCTVFQKLAVIGGGGSDSVGGAVSPY